MHVGGEEHDEPKEHWAALTQHGIEVYEPRWCGASIFCWVNRATLCKIWVRTGSKSLEARCMGLRHDIVCDSGSVGITWPDFPQAANILDA